MQSGGIFASLPMWMIFVLTFALALGSVEAGYRWGRYRQARAQAEKEAPVGAMVGATLGLLAFLLAFTFGLAADAYQARKTTVLDEANAIRVVYMMTGMVPEPQRSDVRSILRDYVDERLQWAGVRTARGDRSGEALLADLSMAANAVGAQNPGGYDVFLDSVNRMIKLRYERELVRERSHIPAGFWAVLYLITALAFAAMGYHGGVAGTTRGPVMIAAAITFTLVIVVIVDLDRPGEGVINVSQQAMIDLANSLAAMKN